MSETTQSEALEGSETEQLGQAPGDPMADPESQQQAAAGDGEPQAADGGGDKPDDKAGGDDKPGEEQKDAAEGVRKLLGRMEKRFNGLTREKHEAIRRAEAAEQKAVELERRLGGAQPPAGDQGQQQQSSQQPQSQQSDAERQAAIRAEAERLVRDEAFNKACNTTYEKGVAEFKDFDDAVKSFNMAESTPAQRREILEAINDMDAPAKVLRALGRDPDEAERLMALPPVRMARELDKFAAKLAQPKPVSAAPKPVPPVSGAPGRRGDGLSNDLPIDEWMRRDAERDARRRAAAN